MKGRTVGWKDGQKKGKLSLSHPLDLLFPEEGKKKNRLSCLEHDWTLGTM